jgi:hypothetical protein
VLRVKVEPRIVAGCAWYSEIAQPSPCPPPVPPVAVLSVNEQPVIVSALVPEAKIPAPSHRCAQFSTNWQPSTCGLEFEA